MGDLSEPVPRRLRDEFEKARLDRIRTDLVVCLMLATVSATAYNMGDREHAERTLASAEKGYSDMLSRLIQNYGDVLPARRLGPGVWR